MTLRARLLLAQAPLVAALVALGGVAFQTLRSLGDASENGRLYSVDARLRPHGASGPLALPLDAFIDYYHGQAQTWERLALNSA